jgi:2-C-methyl-D-erythritol 4-phosphate cytidylyltransferase/2-C-methyl-D-erythritol 2,4-cyclodiphosphate synthase
VRNNAVVVRYINPKNYYFKRVYIKISGIVLSTMATWAVVVAAGSGQRYGNVPKQFVHLWGKPVVAWSIEVARTVADSVVVVIPEPYLEKYSSTLMKFGADFVVKGGITRSDSVRCALELLDDKAQEVLIHDGARPLATRELWMRVLSALRGAGVSGVELPPAGVVPALRLTDTIKEVENSTVLSTIPRDNLYVIQTPQAFLVEPLKKAHESKPNANDDAELLERMGYVVRVVPGENINLKLTYPEDFEMLKRLAIG